MMILRGALWVCLLMILTLVSKAQQAGRLPDSISTTEEQPPSAAGDATDESDTGAKDSSVTQAADSIQFRSVPDSVLWGYKRSREFAYANDSAYWKITVAAENRPNPVVAMLISMLTYLILAAAAGFGIYALVREGGFRFFFRSSRKIGSPALEAGTVDPLKDNLDLQIEEALRIHHHRLVIRLLFLKALQMLDNRGMIRYQPKATNHDYVLQMAAHREGDRFRFLSGAYEHVWYGSFQLDKGQFDRLWQYFQDFYQKLNQG